MSNANQSGPCCGGGQPPEKVKIELPKVDLLDPSLLENPPDLGLEPVDPEQLDPENPLTTSNYTVSGVQLAMNYSVLKSLGLSDALNITDAEKAALDGEIFVGEEDQVDVKKTPIGISSIPENVGEIPPNPAVLSESLDAETPRTHKELFESTYDRDTKMNVVVPDGSTTSQIGFSNLVQSNTPIIGNKPMSGLRDALNRSKIKDEAAIKAFDLLGYPYNLKITLSELLLDLSGMKRNTPIDPFVLALIANTLQGKISINFGYVMSAMGGVEPQGTAITL